MSAPLARVRLNREGANKFRILARMNEIDETLLMLKICARSGAIRRQELSVHNQIHPPLLDLRPLVLRRVRSS